MNQAIINQIQQFKQTIIMLYHQGQYEQAIIYAKQACDLAKSHSLTNEPIYANCLNNLALLYKSMEQYEEALPLHKQALEIHRKSLGTNHPDYAHSLNNLALLYKSMGRYEEALSLHKQALEICSKSLGTDHSDYAVSLNNLASLYQSIGKYGESLSLYQQALEIRSKSLGINHPNYATSLNNLAALYQSMGQYSEAESFYQQALENCRKNLGIDHPNYADFLNNLASLYQLMGQYERALPLFRQVLENRRKSLGINHPNYANSLYNLSTLYQSMGQYKEALYLHRNFLENCGKNLEDNHPDYANSLHNLATLYQLMGQYEEALHLHKKLLKICHNNLDDNHPDYANSLHNLASLYQLMGQYEEAFSLVQQALEIRSKSLGSEHPDYADSLHNLASLYQLMGQYEEAFPLVQQALEIRSKSLGSEHPDYAGSLNNLASLYDSTGQYEEALPLYKQALEIKKKSLGINHPDYAGSLNNLAGLYKSMRQYGEALSLLRQALEIRSKSLGCEHPEYADSLHNLALLYKSIGLYEDAAHLYQQALEIREKSLGSEHPDYADSLNNLAFVYAATNRPEKSLKLMQKAAEIDLKTISKIFNISTDNQRLTYLKQNYHKVEIFLSLVFQHFPNNPTAVQSAYNLILRRKAIATGTTILHKIAFLSQEYAHLAPKIKQWQQIRQQLAKRCFDIPTPEQIPYYRQEIDSLHKQADNIERELNIPELNLEKKLQKADFRSVALELPEGTTLIEFVRFNNYNFQAIPANGDAPSFPPRYLAFILPSHAPEQLIMIDLGEAEPIDKLVKEFRESVENGRGLDLTPIPKEDDISLKIALRKLIFDKLKPYLTQELFICPDGELTCLPFEILPTDEGGYLMDKYRFNFLNVGRDILRFKVQIPANITHSLVIANPNYNLALGSPENTPSTAEIEQIFAFNPTFRDLASSRQGQIFNPLPGTQIEGETIAKALGVKAVTAAKALKSLVSKAQKAPYILHIATHGYFLGDIPPNLDTINQNIPLSSLSASETFQFGAMQNPLLRSGLAFAGVNTMLNGGKLPDEAEDGLLTSLDIQSINLAGTELVVTSACETALGDIHTGETLIGLRRSFIQAGAKTVIISLWKVDDVATTILMQYFYDYLLNDRISKAESLRKAKSSLQHLTIGKMRSQWLTKEALEWAEKHSRGVADYLGQLSQKSDFERPYKAPKYWAAFICLGNPAPIL